MFTDLIQQLRERITRLDPATLHPRDAVNVLDELDELARLATGGKALVAPRAAQSMEWARGGHLSPENWLATKTGTTVAEARQTLETGERVQELPEVEAALRTGQLSAKQAAIVADAAAADPEAQTRLLADARKGESIKALQDTAERIKAAARGEDAEAAHARIYRARSLYSGTRADGSAYLTLQGTRDAIAEWRSHHKPFFEEVLRDAARRTGTREPFGALEFDAAIAMARASTSARADGTSKVPAKLFLRVDYEAFCRGIVAEGETCEIDGFGPVPVSVARRFAEDAFVVGVLTKGTEVAKLAHFGRRPIALQQSYIEWNATGCQVEGCTRTHTEIHHGGEGWAKTHETRGDDLWRLCDDHHDLITYKGYRMVPSDLPGRVRLLPPDGPDPP